LNGFTIFAALKFANNVFVSAFGLTVFAGFFSFLAFTALPFFAETVEGSGSGAPIAGSVGTPVASDSVATTGLGVARIGIPNSSAPSGAQGLSSARAPASSNAASSPIASSGAVRLAFRDSSSVFLAESEARNFAMRFRGEEPVYFFDVTANFLYSEIAHFIH
jgi:hypothetical protein